MIAAWSKLKTKKKKQCQQSKQFQHNCNTTICTYSETESLFFLDISTVWKFPCNNSLHISSDST